VRIRPESRDFRLEHLENSIWSPFASFAVRVADCRRKPMERTETAAAAMKAIERELFRNLFVSVAEEMGIVLRRTAFSPNIKERRITPAPCTIPMGHGCDGRSHARTPGRDAALGGRRAGKFCV